MLICVLGANKRWKEVVYKTVIKFNFGVNADLESHLLHLQAL